MARRRSRKKARDEKKPELRSSNPEKRQRRKEREEAGGSPNGPALRLRPAGRGGFALVSLGGWLVVAAVLAAAWAAGRWGAVWLADSAWLYVAVGVAIAAPAVGYVARARADVNGWLVQGTVVAALVLAVEIVRGPTCPTGASCASFGALGLLGPAGSAAVILGLALLGRILGVVAHDVALGRRRESGVAAGGLAFRTVVGMGFILGAPLLLAAAAVDAAARPQAQYAKVAVQQASDECFGLFETPGKLEVRADPSPRSSFWSNYLVRRAGEDRPDVGGKKLPAGWASSTEPHPYEAMVSIDDEGALGFMQCRKLNPADGNATEDDLKEPDYGSETPIAPQQLLQPPSDDAAEE